MATKIALIAALCVAQAFAFPPLTEEVARAVGNKDLRIVMDCFKQQGGNVELMAAKAARVSKIVLDGLDGEIRDAAAKYLKKTEQPVARIGVTMLDIHSDMYTNLNRLDVNKAFDVLSEGVKKIEGIMGEIRNELNQAIVERPELTDAMDWYMRYLSFSMDVTVPKIRRDFGECLFRGRPSLWS